MNWLDIVILSVIGLSALISLVRGFAKEALSLVIWFGAFFIASQYYSRLAVYFTKIQDEMFRDGAAIAALFVATLIVGALVKLCYWAVDSENGFVRNRSGIGYCIWRSTWSADCLRCTVFCRYFYHV